MFALALVANCLLGAEPLPADFTPDPLSVQRFEKGYRYPQAGWIVLHIEGEPYERGYQHGRLMAPEIVGFVKCFATQQGHKDPENAWKQTRTLANAVFLRGFDAEYLEEMKGISDGAAAAGAKFDGRPLDLIDIAAVNLWPEIESLDDALGARPTGLEGKVFRPTKPRAMPKPKEDHCSAFAATGPATADGQIVFGHITMFGLYPANFFNVWIDVKPAKGHRVLMQTYPGGIQSGMDYYLSSSGLMVTETTIAQTRFEPNTKPLATRIRKALQYANSIDELTAELTKDNNGLYTNEWLIGDAKTNEIAMLELGSKRHTLRRSSKNEWYGDTPGFYWGCNNTKDLDLRLETIASVHDRPANFVWKPSDRDATWRRLYDQHKGKITADFGREAFTAGPLCAYHSLDAKYTTTAMAKELKTWALFGPPLGKTWEPTHDERTSYPDIQPLVSNPWTVLHPAAPAGKSDAVAKDISDKVTSDAKDDDEVHTQAAWHGTLLPKTDADAWLAAAFSEFERIVALENALRERNHGELTAGDEERLAVARNAHRSRYLAAARRVGDVALADTKETRDRAWVDIVTGKGVMALHELRRSRGATKFDDLMDKFGRRHAGQSAALNELFAAFLAKEAGVDVTRSWEPWVKSTGLPNGKPRSAYVIRSFHDDRPHTLIVYGTRDEVAANRAAADTLQETIRKHKFNETVRVVADTELTDAEAKSNHLLLIGRPNCNRWTERVSKQLPVAFGQRSFAAGGEHYANATTAVIAAADNPLNEKFSVVVVAGLSAHATALAPKFVFATGTDGADVLIVAKGSKSRAFVSSQAVDVR